MEILILGLCVALAGYACFDVYQTRAGSERQFNLMVKFLEESQLNAERGRGEQIARYEKVMESFTEVIRSDRELYRDTVEQLSDKILSRNYTEYKASNYPFDQMPEHATGQGDAIPEHESAPPIHPNEYAKRIHGLYGPQVLDDPGFQAQHERVKQEYEEYDAKGQL